MIEKENDMNRSYRYLSKGELKEANRRAVKTGCRAVDPEYIEGLADNLRYPIFFELPWERHGWVRCQIGTGDPATEEYVPVFVDVPRIIYDNLGVVEVPESAEQKA
jgi:hypothetical protein